MKKKSLGNLSVYLAAFSATMLLGTACVEEPATGEADIEDTDADKNGRHQKEFPSNQSWELSFQCNEFFSCDVGVIAGACPRGGDDQIYSGRLVGTITATVKGDPAEYSYNVYDVLNGVQYFDGLWSYTWLVGDLDKNADVTVKYTPIEGIDGTCMLARVKHK